MDDSHRQRNDPLDTTDGGQSGEPRRALDASRTLTIVSGLPRSGTSMMMQMLEAAGLEIATDGRRRADPDNPKGYLELEAVKRLPEDASFVPDAAGKAVKVVAPLLRFLPSDHDYRVLFMERNLPEVLESQQAMLERIGGEDPRVDETALAKAFAGQLDRAKLWLAESENVRTCFVSYQDTLSNPFASAEIIAAFLDEMGAFEGKSAANRSSAAQRMASAVDPTLYRRRRDRQRAF